jgi:hypothetical protein
MKRSLILILVLGALASGCEYNNLEIACYKGHVIMSSCCTGSSFIDIGSKIPIGKTTSINGKNYSNVIQVPGYLNDGEIYLKLRKFDSSRDQNLFPPIYCYCLIAIGLDVPIYVATSYSYVSCPGNSR